MGELAGVGVDAPPAAKEVAAGNAFPPRRPSCVRQSSEGMEAMARDAKETRRQILQEARSQQWWESLCLTY
jgi:hypothetical protein